MPIEILMDWEWIEKHSSEEFPPFTQGDGGKLLSDGARVDGFGHRTEPPPGLAGLRARLAYHVAKKEQAEQAFFRLKAALLSSRFQSPFHWSQEDFGPAPPNGLAGLGILKQIASRNRKAEAEVKQQIGEDAKVAEAEHGRELLRMIETRAREESAAWADAVSSITLEDNA
jgi:hypothetical protein